MGSMAICLFICFIRGGGRKKICLSVYVFERGEGGRGGGWATVSEHILYEK